MAGDNPTNNERWKVHGSHAEYWRADNPYIVAWYRFGEDEFPIADAVGVPEKTDSGPRHHHLAANEEPNTFLQHVSGIAPWSVSGIQFTGINWPIGGPDAALRTDSDYYRDRSDNTTMGYHGVGNAVTSGFTIMGWFQTPHATVNLNDPRVIWANIEQGVSATDGEWRLFAAFNTPLRIGFQFHSFGTATSPAGATHTVLSTQDANGSLPIDEPVFFAAQINKGAPATSELPGEGSGIMRLFMGTTISGLHEVAALQITIPSTDFWRGDNTVHGNTNFPYTICADPVSARGNTDPRALPPDAIADEFIIVNDGNLSLERMAHYMNSGIIQDDQDPLGLVEGFVPALPGTDDLVAYWTFDEQGGENTAPELPDASLDFILDGVDFVAGVRGGSGIRPNSLVGDYDTYTLATNKNGLPHIPAGSGVNFLFPEHDQTWIGWVRSEGASDHGGALGWFGPTADRHTALYWGCYILGATSARPSNLDMGLTPSGALFDNIATAAAISAGFNPNDARTMQDGDWHLLAVVFDITHGFIRVVYDAMDVYPVLITESIAVSGLTKEHVLGPDDAAFILGNTDNTNRCSYDDWAVYDRVLSIPEMSGYALSGIDVAATPSPIDTSFKRTLGYWKLDETEVFDPEGVSGLRYADDSWYRHHLTRVSGNFEQGSALNDNIADTTASVKTSGSILAVPQTDSGPNLDFGASGVWASSGFTAGCWMYLPSGDLQTQGNGSSGLVNDKMFMGVWGQDEADQSWLLGMRDNKFLGGVRFPGFSATFVESESGVPFNTPFFVAMKVRPSGSASALEIFVSENDTSETDLQLVARDVGLVPAPNLGGGSASGFSLFGAPNLQFGFPSGTRMQMPFVYAGSLSEQDIAIVKVVGVNDNVLASGGVSTSDPANISHWRFDKQAIQFQDVGRAQNYLTVVNTDGNDPGVETAIHNNGVVVRQDEYYTTQTDSTISGLDLATDDKSWTFLTWIKPNASTFNGEGVVMGKGGPSSGVEVYMADSTFRPSSRVSGVITQSFNGDLAPGEWNHLAIVFDKNNNEFETIVNGRYAGGQFNPLLQAPINNSGLAIGGRGDQLFQALFGGPQFSGVLDDTMLFSRALTLPEISGLAANSYNFAETQGTTSGFPIGGYLFGITQNLVSGLIGSFIHGQAQDLELVAGYVSGVSGALGPIGGFIHGRAQVSGVVGSFLHGAGQQSGVFGHFLHGLDIVSGLIGSYMMGARQDSSEFDITLNFRVVAFDEFDARLGVEKTDIFEFDARLGVIRITRPPRCSLELPLVGTVGSGVPFDLTITGSGIAQDDKKIAAVRFTFADFKGAESGTLIGGETNSGLYQATRQFDTPGWYTVKIEILDSYGYRSSCCRPFLLLPSGSTSGTFLNSLPGISISASPVSGSAIEAVSFIHSISGIDTTSGLLEYTDFADQQESLVNSLEMPLGTQFTDLVRRHDYTMPGKYCAVWSVSGEFGIVSDTISDGIDYLA